MAIGAFLNNNTNQGMLSLNNLGLHRMTQKARESSNQDLINSGNAFEYKPISYRTYDAEQKRDDAGRFTKGYNLANERIAESYEDSRTQKTLPVNSTAIANARYDPSDDSLNITYTSGPKEYKFKAGGKEGLQEWMSAMSKGRITQEWKDTHRWPGY